MYNRFMSEKEINVKVGDVVCVQGNKGVVTEVFHSIDGEWNGKEYVKIAGSESTAVRVNFVGELASWGQYQGCVYGGYAVISGKEYKNTDTGEMFTIEELIDLWAQFKNEMRYNNFDEFVGALKAV